MYDQVSRSFFHLASLLPRALVATSHTTSVATVPTASGCSLCRIHTPLRGRLDCGEPLAALARQHASALRQAAEAHAARC